MYEVVTTTKHESMSLPVSSVIPVTTVVANAKMKKELQEIENRILFLLSNSKGNILDDHELIETLASSKKTSTEITLKVIECTSSRILLHVGIASTTMLVVKVI